jgi:hypothetical protein
VRKGAGYRRYTRSPAITAGDKKMDEEWKPSKNDVIMVLEAHHLIPSGPLLEDALQLTSVYADRSYPRQSTEKKPSWHFLKRDSCRKASFPIVIRIYLKCQTSKDK